MCCLLNWAHGILQSFNKQHFSPKPCCRKHWQQVFVVLSRWQRLQFVQPGTKMTSDFTSAPKSQQHQHHEMEAKKCTYSKIQRGGGGTSSYDEDWSTARNLVTFHVRDRLLRDLRWKPAHCSFFCLFLPLDANMRKITGSRFQIPETTAWLDASFGLASCLGMEAVLNHRQLRVCARVRALAGRRTSWTRE